MTADPDITIKERQKDDRFIVIACDGIWDVCSNEECTGMVKGMIEEKENDPMLMSEEVSGGRSEGAIRLGRSD